MNNGEYVIFVAAYVYDNNLYSGNIVFGVREMSHIWWNWGRVLYGIPLSITGLIYIFFPQASVETLTSFIPGGVILIYFAGVLWVFLGLFIALNWWTRYMAWGVIGLLLAIQIIVHVPAAYTGEYLAIVWFELLRDVSLLGGAFFVMAVDGAREQRRSNQRVAQDSIY